MIWRLEAIGGPYDGTPGLGFNSVEDGTERELPERIYIARCYSVRTCGFDGLVHPHPFFWDDCDEAPPGAIEYRFSDSSEEIPDGEKWPVARYVFGAVDLDGVADRELVGVGSGHA